MKGFMNSVLTCTIIGIGFAGLFGYWNANGILIDEYIAGTITITDLQTIVIFLWSLLGVILGVGRRR